MTREDAIKWLKQINAKYISGGDESFDESRHEAIDMAISALHFEADCRSCMWREKYEEQTEPSDDIEGDIDFHCDLKHNRMTFFNHITESPNEVVETDDEVIESVRCEECEWFKNCEYFKKPPCTKQTEPSDLMSHEEAWNTIESDLISRADAHKAICRLCSDYERCEYSIGKTCYRAREHNAIDKVPSVSADRPTEDYSDLPDIPRAYYEKIVGNMSHEINMLKQQLEDRPTHERDLISRHEALMELNGACEMWEDDAIVADIIHKLPLIEIVRCKDCYYYDKGENESESWQYCTYTRVAVNDDGFCSWAVMKGGTE